MQVAPVGQQLLVRQTAGSASGPEDGAASFTEMLSDAVRKLNDTQVKADNLTYGLLTGEIQDIHQVTVAMQEAKLALQLAVEVRNKVIEAYQEISRMQV